MVVTFCGIRIMIIAATLIYALFSFIVTSIYIATMKSGMEKMGHGLYTSSFLTSEGLDLIITGTIIYFLMAILFDITMKHMLVLG